MVLLGWLVVALVVLAQTVVTGRLWRSEMYTRAQKMAQGALIWLLPVAGATIVYAGLRMHDDVSRPEPNPELGEHEALYGQLPPPDGSGDP